MWESVGEGGRGRERVGECGRRMLPSVAHLWPSGRAHGFSWALQEAGLPESLRRFQTSLCLPHSERGLDPHTAPPEVWVQSIPRELPIPNHCPALRPFCSSLCGKSWGPGARVGGGQADAVGQLRRLTEVQGRGDELGAGGGSHTVNAGPAGGAQGRGEGRPLTLDLGAPRLTISPLLSAESLCPHRWLSGRCSGPGNTGRCSGLDSPLTTPADGVANQPTALSVAGSPSALPRRCGLHPSQSCRHPGRAGDGEQSVSCPHPIRNLARLGRAGETGLG